MTRPPHDASLEQALALGGTRKATAAHPDCICGKFNPDGDELRLVTLGIFTVWTQGGTYRPADCPQHKPDPQ